MHPESLVLEYFLDPNTQSPKLPQLRSRAEHTYFTNLQLCANQRPHSINWMRIHCSAGFNPIFCEFLLKLSQFKEEYMLVMDYTFRRGEYFPDHAKNATWKILHSYIYAHIGILMDEYPGYGVQAITIFQSLCENMSFAYRRRYN